VGWIVRKVPTASGATAVQVVHKRGRVVLEVDHVGSAHDADELALLEETARRRLYAGQQILDLDVPGQGRTDPGSAVVEATSSRILWDALSDLYEALGFAVVRDEAFRALVLGRIVEPTSKLDTVRVLGELGVESPSRVTFMRCLKRVVEPALQEAGFSFIVGSKSSKAPYDLTEHFEKRGNAFDDGQTIEATRTMGTGKKARDRRVVWQWSFKRYRYDIQAINAMVGRAEAVADGKRALKKDRFVKVTDADPTVDWDLVKRAQHLAGLKGYADLWIMPI
jgi:hypothetical protein